ncbi:MAG: hypothetical protein AB7S70_15680 [Hyphomicrobium sp.]|uniref:hypothetical protein n=1 Tax=Hyphomicrobium sp. TaxID=82 RepID=UPI003D0B2C05
MWDFQPVLWPVTWEGWLFQPFVVWLLVVNTGALLISYAPEAWQDGLGLVTIGSAFFLTLAILFLKTDPGPGWFAGWEKERQLVPRFGWLSSILYLAGLGVGFWLLVSQLQRPALMMLFLLAYALPALALLYKDAELAKGGEEFTLSKFGSLRKTDA